MYAFSGRLALASFALVLAGLADDTPQYAPPEGWKVRRTLTANESRRLERVVRRFGDEEKITDEVELSAKSTTQVVVVDEFEEVAKSGPRKIVRAYETLSKERVETHRSKEGPKTREKKESCDLEGLSVTFTWNAAKQAFEPAFTEGEHDKALLADLYWDMDYTVFLPDHAVAEGDEWEVDFDLARAALYRPGGELGFHGETPAPAGEKQLRATAWDAMKGELTAKHAGLREDDGKKLLVIAIEGRVKTEAELELGSESPGLSAIGASTDETVEGRLTWDLEAGTARSMEVSFKGSFTFTQKGSARTKDGLEVAVSQSFEHADEDEWKVVFETL